MCLISGRKCHSQLRQLADHIEKVTFDTGVAKTTGGGIDIAGGLSAVGGLIFAPITGGLSLGLTIGGAVAGVASAATTITASLVQSGHLKTDGKAAKELIDELSEWDKIVNAEMNKFRVR